MSVERIKRARAIIKAKNLDGLLVSNLINVRYLSGFTGTEGTLLITKRSAVFFSDSRYTIQAGKQITGARLVTFKSKITEIGKAVKNSKITRLGIEGDTMTVNQRNAMNREFKDTRLIALSDSVDALRLCKSPDEIKALHAVIALSEKALKKVLPKLKPGVVESDFARMLEIQMIKEGAEGLAFDTIVGSGPRGALPHGVAAGRKIKEGELVVIDYGAVLNGYHSDQTVTVPVGEVTKKAREVYEIVYQAQQAAINAARPGITGKQLDAVARNIIVKSGYGKLFGHGLGHGVGLEIHEGPRTSPLSNTKLAPGMVVTIEPGIYLEGKFGVRLEDMILITKNGCEKLTTINKAWK